MHEVKPIENIIESSELSREDWRAKWSPSFMKTARQYTWLTKSFRINEDKLSHGYVWVNWVLKICFT